MKFFDVLTCVLVVTTDQFTKAKRKQVTSAKSRTQNR